MSKSYRKNIACIESLWNDDLENRLTVAPILNVLATANHVKFTHLTCNTLEELDFNLCSLPNRRGYEILYLAFHGCPGEIWLSNETSVSIEKLASMMKTRFAGWVVHFGSCSTLESDPERLTAFFRQTGIAMMLGYRKDVDWIDSAAMDLILLDWLECYQNLTPMWRRVSGEYPDLVAKTGLTVFPQR